MIREVSAPLTHPATAQFVLAVPLFLTLAALFIAALFSRNTLMPIYQTLLVRYSSRHRIQHVDPALIYIPELMTAQQFVLAGVVTLLGIGILLWFLGAAWLALVLSPFSTLLVMWLVLKLAEQRYKRRLEAMLAPTVARMAALLANGSGFQPVLRRMIEDLPEGPLRQEWRFVVERLGVPLVAGGLATPQLVVDALRFQTPSYRHRVMLEHLAVALGQTHDILVRRLQAASQALYDSDRRQSAAATELAQMRYSGAAVGLAGLFMVGYLGVTQSERFLTAYRGWLGVIVGVIVGSALLAPLIGGLLLARSDDLDY